MPTRTLILVTHLLGAGHLVRAAALARACARAGQEVTLVSGGRATAQVDSAAFRFVQLPPVQARPGAFTALLDETGAPVGEERLAARRSRLLSAFREARPQVVVTELFPFGRRVLRAEFEALLDAVADAPERPALAASVRDVLAAPRDPAKVRQAHDLVRRRYDAVLVHGDEALIPLEASWPVDEALRPRLHYTGYVDPAAPAVTRPSLARPALQATQPPHPEVLRQRDRPSAGPITGSAEPRRTHNARACFEGRLPRPPQHEEVGKWTFPQAFHAEEADPPEDATVLVSGGSSAASLPLYRAALAAAREFPARSWRILVGAGVADGDFAALAAEAGPQAHLERARTDFRALMSRCHVFVGQAGYNTAVDILATRPRTVLVPFEEGGETEQRIRASELARRGLVRMLPESELDGPRLAALVRDAAEGARPEATAVRRNGADEAAALIGELASTGRIGNDR